jgi:hypothetical protein
MYGELLMVGYSTKKPMLANSMIKVAPQPSIDIDLGKISCPITRLF